MDERDKQILKELSEILVNFRRCLNNEEKNRGNWQPNDDWINEVHYPTQEDVNAITGVLGIIDHLNKQLAEVKEAGGSILEEIEISAKILQKRLCTYGSVQGPGLEPSGRCDCKYIQVVRTGSTEETGCCESRQIILLSRRLTQTLGEVKRG